MAALTPIARVHAYPEAMVRWLQPAMPRREVVGLADEAAFLAAAPEIEILVAAESPTDDWTGATRLRLLHAIGAGVDSLLPAPGLDPGTLIANTSGIHLPAMSEWIVAALLAANKQFEQLFDQQRDRRWRPRLRVRPLAGSTICILGLGTIGADVARLLQPFGVTVVGTQRNPSAVPGVSNVYGAEQTTAAMQGADALIVTLPRTDKTVGIVGAVELDGLADGAILVDVSRGGVVDTAAVVAALEQGKLQAAVLDVWELEPLPSDSPFWAVPGLIVTPHTSGGSSTYFELAAARIADNVERLETDRPLLSLVDRDAGY